MSKKVFIILSSLFILCSIKITGQEKGTGIGLIIGEPTGLIGKYWLNEINAVDLALAYSFVGKNSSVSIHSDYLYHKFDIFPSEEKFVLYYGFGVRIRFVNNDKNSLGARGLAGLSWFNKEYPIDIFLEAAPVFTLLPSTALNLDLSIGARYFFR
ncbi:hypothetical protein ABRY23_11765 [Melioribacteraceae bacterium 4301-Me]|uniref:hypothetical protein n=1 Tax=Pyranulibacter aquaticus TaxID=3163344 RepID=UPI003599A230